MILGKFCLKRNTIFFSCSLIAIVRLLPDRSGTFESLPCQTLIARDCFVGELVRHSIKTTSELVPQISQFSSVYTLRDKSMRLVPQCMPSIKVPQNTHQAVKSNLRKLLKTQHKLAIGKQNNNNRTMTSPVINKVFLASKCFKFTP